MKAQIILLTLIFFGATYGQAEDSSEIVRLSWQASKDGDLKALSSLADEVVKDYGDKAKALSAQLTNFPARTKVDDYKILSDVATCLFIKAEATMHAGKNDEARAQFKDIIVKYPYKS